MTSHSLGPILVSFQGVFSAWASQADLTGSSLGTLACKSEVAHLLLPPPSPLSVQPPPSPTHVHLTHSPGLRPCLASLLLLSTMSLGHLSHTPEVSTITLAAVPQALTSPTECQAQVSNLVLGISIRSYGELKFNTFANALPSLSN